MTMLVPLYLAANYLHIDSGDDEVLTVLIQSASSSILNYLKDTSPYVLDDEGNPTIDVRPEVKAAVLLLAGEMSAVRDAERSSVWQNGTLPPSVANLLIPLRTPTLA